VHSAVFLKTNQTRRIRFHGKVRSWHLLESSK
jgi:hypothetical protein